MHCAHGHGLHAGEGRRQRRTPCTTSLYHPDGSCLLRVLVRSMEVLSVFFNTGRHCLSHSPQPKATSHRCLCYCHSFAVLQCYRHHRCCERREQWRLLPNWHHVCVLVVLWDD